MDTLYYSSTKKTYYRLTEMDDRHLSNAFNKLLRDNGIDNKNADSVYKFVKTNEMCYAMLFEMGNRFQRNLVLTPKEEFSVTNFQNYK